MEKSKYWSDTVTALVCWWIVSVNAFSATAQIYETASNEVGEAPIITPRQNETTVKPGESFVFTCESDEPITWTYDDSIVNAFIEATNTSSADFDAAITYNHSSDGGHFQSSIELSNIDYTFVGFYYCVKNSSQYCQPSELLQTKQTSRIYLFVEDLEHPMVLFPHAMLVGSSVDVPCKRTSRKTEVQLVKVYFFSKRNERITYRGSEYEGFKPTNNEQATYHCESGPVTRYITRYETDSLMYPLIPKITPLIDFGIIGEDFELLCTIETSDLFHGLNIAWQTPDDIAIKENRIKIEKAVRRDFQTDHYDWYVFTSKLIVNVFNESKDLGQYQCTSQAGTTFINSTIFNVDKAYNADEIFVNVQNESPQNEFVQSFGDEVEWKVSYEGNPAPSIIWMDNDNKEIPWTETEVENAKFVATKGDNIASLKVRNLNFDDSGDYTIIVDNKRQRKQQSFRLSVEDVPRLNMVDARFRRGESVNITCQIFGYPFSNISMTFQSCDSETYCFGSVVTMASSKQGEIKVTRTINLEPERGQGVVTCSAENSLGSSSTKAHVIFIGSVEEGEEDDVSITSYRWFYSEDGSYIDGMDCSVNTYLYYYHPDDQVIFETTNDDGQTASSYRGGGRNHRTYNIFNWHSKLEMYKPTGKFVCKAKRRKTGLYEEKVFWFNKTQPAEPVSNLTVGEAFVFECEAGDERPTEFRWYKNDMGLDVEDENMKLLGNGALLYIPSVKIENGGRYLCMAMGRLGEVHTERSLNVKVKSANLL